MNKFKNWIFVDQFRFKFLSLDWDHCISFIEWQMGDSKPVNREDPTSKLGENNLLEISL